VKAFVQQQFGLIGAAVVALVVGFAASAFLRGLVNPPWVGEPFYLAPGIVFIACLLFGVGALTLLRAEDRGWPWFLAAIGILVFAIGFEDSIIQWFTIQMGLRTIGGRVNPIAITACLAAVGIALVLHANQLGRRLRLGLSDRGLDARELQEVEMRARMVAVWAAARIVGLGAALALGLFIAEYPLARARLGLNELGILGGILIVAVMVVMAYRILRRGPLGVEEAHPRRRPPQGGLRGR
jgi:hypothetical protein